MLSQIIKSFKAIKGYSILNHSAVIGCVGFEVPEGTEFLVSDRNYSMSVVTCNVTGYLEIWYLNCEDKIWMGDLGNCTSSTF